MREISAIFADWGTTNRRAWAVDRDGAVIDQRKDDQGLLGVKASGSREAQFEASFRGFVGDWLKASAPAAPTRYLTSRRRSGASVKQYGAAGMRLGQR